MPPLATAGTPEPAPVTAAELKIFQLKHQDVIAIAFETCLRTASVPDPLTFKLEPKFHVNQQNGLITITAAAQPALPELNGQTCFVQTISSIRLQQLTVQAPTPGQLTLTVAYNSRTAKPRITTVKRKRVNQPDNTTVYRTYLVLKFAGIQAGSPPKTIVIDPGHGGNDLGAASNYLYEKELNLDIALLSCDIFRQHGYDVYMTRTSDTRPGLLDRADAANILEADAFISIHNNSMPDNMPAPARKLYRGTTVLYNAAAPKPAKELAAIMADELSGALRIHQYPLQDRPGLVVLNSTWVPAVLAEVAMMPHPQDAKMISQRVYRLEAAQAIVQATEKYFKIAALATGRH
ncbi:N-acetylmuramoyl-L-alanine amidase family protein [Sporomusa carbonis]|uniref:N-acetylmuramoyl-L-alanine amidase family protein n=1 Tax=Sporomusa carbonis TaxID=3076075 RepID=UPI003C7D6E1C